MLHPTIPLGRVGGVRLGAHWSVAIIVALIAYALASTLLPAAAPHLPEAVYWVAGVVTAVCFMASLLLHELSHALAARHYRVPVKRITLWMLGGAAQLGAEPPSPRADLLIAAAGPAASLVVGGGCWGLAAGLQELVPPVALQSLLWLGLTNLVIAVFNLLPGTPLDGGRLLRAAVWQRTGDRSRAVRVAGRAGQVVGVLLTVAGFAEVIVFGRFTGLWLVLIGWFLVGAAGAEMGQSGLHDKLAGVTVGAVMTPDPVIAPGWWTVGAFLERVAATTRHRRFPVVSFDGAAEGVVSLTDLLRLAPDDRATTRVWDVCRRPPAVRIVSADTPVSDVLTRSPLRSGQDLVLVTDNGMLVGVVSKSDLTRTVELARLRSG